MRFVITNLGGFHNRGVEAFVLPTIEHIRKRDPHGEIAVLSPVAPYDRLRLSDGEARVVQNDFAVGAGSRRVRRLRRTAAKLLGRRPTSDFNTANRLIQSASAVLAMGGDVFSSDYANLGTHLLPLQYACAQHTPVVFLAHSIGPFATPQEAEAWFDVSQRSLLITARESLTYAYLTDELGLPSELVHLTADPAFLLLPAPPPTVRAMLTFYGLADGDPLVALAPSESFASYIGIPRSQHLQVWRQVIDALLRIDGLHLLLIPHVQNRQAGSDDRLIATDLLRAFEFSPRMHLAGADHTASEFKGLIGACRVLVAERMHAAIAGLSSGVCTVVFGYSVKARGILKDLLGSQALEEGLLIPSDDIAAGIDAPALISNAWDSKDAVSDRLAQSLPEIRGRAIRNYDLLMSALD